MLPTGLPPRQGLYDPHFEHDACGVGFVVDIKGRRSHDLVQKAIRLLLNLFHRGACGCEKNTGDGAGILLQTPHKFLARVAEEAGVRLPAPHRLGDLADAHGSTTSRPPESDHSLTRARSS